MPVQIELTDQISSKSEWSFDLLENPNLSCDLFVYCIFVNVFRITQDSTSRGDFSVDQEFCQTFNNFFGLEERLGCIILRFRVVDPFWSFVTNSSQMRSGQLQRLLKRVW
jgi:hypothetical protein